MRAVHHQAFSDVYGDDGRREERVHYAPGLPDGMRELIRRQIDDRCADHNRLAMRQSGSHRTRKLQAGLADTPLFGTKALL